LEYLGFLEQLLLARLERGNWLHGRSRLSPTGVIMSLENGGKHG
jgi:hypothetical protein